VALVVASSTSGGCAAAPVAREGGVDWFAGAGGDPEFGVASDLAVAADALCEAESFPRQKNKTPSRTTPTTTTASVTGPRLDFAGGAGGFSAEDRSFADDFLPMVDHSSVF
jgi:hypothetical protein